MKQRSNKGVWGFTMVEMLSVLAIIAIIMGMVVPNAMYARVMSEQSAVRAQSATMQVAMANYLAEYGNSGQAKWAAASTNEVYYTLLTNANLLPQVGFDDFSAIYAGYTLTFPSTLTGQIVVTRSADGTAIYP